MNKFNLAAMLPFLDEDELRTLAKKIQNTTDGVLDGLKLVSLLPFMDDDDIRDLAEGEILKGRSIVSFLPFMDSDDVEQLVREYKDILVSKASDLKHYLPFIDDEDFIAELVNNLVDRNQTDNLSAFLPFISDEECGRIMIKLAKKNINPTCCYPFADEDSLHELVTLVVTGKVDIELDSLYPFMDEEGIKEIFNYFLCKQNRNLNLVMS